MLNSVPADYFVQINPEVLAAGGNGLELVGLVLTEGTRVPIGTIQSFSSLLSVGAYFGTTSVEYDTAAIYFGGFDNSNIKPGSILFAQYPTAAVSAYLRGGAVGAALTLTQLKALTAATLTITVDGGAPKVSASINLSGATSFSNAATIIQTAFTAPGFTVTYDSVAEAFVFTDTTTGPTATLTYCTSSGALATSLMLTAATGAVLSQGAAIATPAAFMASIVNQTTNWASFMTIFNPDVSGNANKLAFATWNSTQNNGFVYVCWDTDITATTTVPATTSLGYLLSQSNISGTCLVYDPSNEGLAAFVCGMIASIDFNQTNGNINPAFKGQSGLAATVTDETSLDNLKQNGYNAMVASATAAQEFLFFYNGQVSGEWLWLQPYVNQIWLNAGFQLDLMLLLTSAKSIPYNEAGRALISASLMDTINAALNFGAIQPGVNLSSLQIAEVNAAAGIPIDQVLGTRGWYLQVGQTAPAVRQARGTPPCNFWYTDGGSVNTISLASIDLL